MIKNVIKSFCAANAINLLLTAVLLLGLSSCKKQKKIFLSNCNDAISYRHIAFNQLIDSITLLDKQYIEVSGNYREGKEESALFNDSLFVDHSNSHAIWINFSQDCPLFLKGTRTGLFEYNDGRFTQLNNRQVTIRGIIDVGQKGHSHSYKASINRVSYIEF